MRATGLHLTALAFAGFVLRVNACCNICPHRDNTCDSGTGCSLWTDDGQCHQFPISFGAWEWGDLDPNSPCKVYVYSLSVGNNCGCSNYKYIVNADEITCHYDTDVQFRINCNGGSWNSCGASEPQSSTVQAQISSAAPASSTSAFIQTSSSSTTSSTPSSTTSSSPSSSSTTSTQSTASLTSDSSTSEPSSSSSSLTETSVTSLSSTSVSTTNIPAVSVTSTSANPAPTSQDSGLDTTNKIALGVGIPSAIAGVFATFISIRKLVKWYKERP